MGHLPDRLALRPGEAHIVRLPSSAAAGYRWQATVEDDAIVGATVRFDHALTTARGPAFSAHELLTLEARAPGTTHVHCMQRRGWEQDTLPLATYTLTVNVVASDGDTRTSDEKGSHGI